MEDDEAIVNKHVKELSAAARALPADDLADLVDELLAALYESDPGWDKAWAAEARRRMDAYRRGEMEASPAADVLRRMGKP